MAAASAAAAGSERVSVSGARLLQPASKVASSAGERFDNGADGYS